MKKLFCVLLCLVLTSTFLVHAEESIQTIPPGEDKITSVKKGEAAPYDGQLFDNYTALRWGNWLLQYKLRLQLDADYQKKVAQADADLAKKKLEIAEEKYKTVTLDYQKQVAERDAKIVKLEDTPWFKSVWFGVVCGVVLTGTTVGLGVYAAK